MLRPLLAALNLTLTLALAGAPGPAAAAAPGAGPDELLRARFEGDRTRACVVAAQVDRQQVRTGRHCARTGTLVDAATGFEIGSVTKTMLAALVALRLADGRWSLQDRALRHLPPIEPADPRLATVTVQHLLTHAAGLPALPPTMKVPDAANPYGALTVDELLASLRGVRLDAEPGTRTQYSNFGMLVLSAMLSHHAGQPFTKLAEQELLAPLGMAATGPATATTQGHTPTGQPVPGWTTAPELAGAGFLRSTLNDLVRYAQAHLGGPAPGRAAVPALQQALAATRQPLALGHGMAWRTPSIGGRTVAVHEGATAGFSSVVAIDGEARRAAVVLADTSLADLGGLADVALRLVGLDVPLARPRREVDAAPELQRALVGDYELAGQALRIRLQGKRLTLQGPVGDAVTLRHDSAGDFFADGLPAVLRARPVDGRIDGFVWRQGGGVLTAQRRQAAPGAGPAIELAADALGRYQLLPGFELRVFRDEGRTRVQASGQPALDVHVTAPDALSAPAVGLVIRFERNAAGEVTGLVLEQGGQKLQGRKQP